MCTWLSSGKQGERIIEEHIVQSFFHVSTRYCLDKCSGKNMTLKIYLHTMHLSLDKLDLI